MFKFMKSKKGFTLVELMIVVVIMAILVAVAVPIYSAVTKNARKKTCLANQRAIISQINNQSMGGTAIAAGTYKLTTNANGDGATWDATATAAGIDKLFQKAPYCPEKESILTVTVAASAVTGADENGQTVTVSCSDTEHK